MVTVALAVAVCPLSSDTVQVICAGPVEAPVEEYVAEVPLPLMVPLGSLVAIGERTVLWADALCRDGRRITRPEISWIR